MKNASLVVVGSGIKFLSHLTTEAKVHIEQADVVLYLVNEPLMKKWIEKVNPNAESLDTLYIKHQLRLDCYQEITRYILEKVNDGYHVCVVFYGHPVVFAQSSLEAVKQARKAGYDARVLPAISAEACLFADLLVDPSSCGCQSFETTDFLIHRRSFNFQSHLILWQVGIIGALTHAIKHDNRLGITVLYQYLKQFYPDQHPIVIYEAAQYPSFPPRIDEMSLSDLQNAHFTTISTLYIPPLGQAACSIRMLDALKINIRDLK